MLRATEQHISAYGAVWVLPVSGPFGKAATRSEVLVASETLLWHQAVQAALLDKGVSVATLSHQPPPWRLL